jgi:hypothetical protein
MGVSVAGFADIRKGAFAPFGQFIPKWFKRLDMVQEA